MTLADQLKLMPEKNAEARFLNDLATEISMGKINDLPELIAHIQKRLDTLTSEVAEIAQQYYRRET